MSITPPSTTDAAPYAMQFTPELIDSAFHWICHNRKDFPPNADIWHLRFHWKAAKCSLLRQLQQGEYRLSPLQVIRKSDAASVAVWSAQDAE